MDDFLYSLKVQLISRLMPKQVDEQMELYENYINEQVAGGQTMEQVLRELGDPQKLAELIAEDYEEKFQEKKAEEEARMDAELGMARRLFGMKELSEEEMNAQITNPEHGFQAEYSKEKGWEVHPGKMKFNLNSWYGRLLILGIILVVYIVFKELGGN